MKLKFEVMHYTIIHKPTQKTNNYIFCNNYFFFYPGVYNNLQILKCIGHGKSGSKSFFFA